MGINHEKSLDWMTRALWEAEECCDMGCMEKPDYGDTESSFVCHDQIIWIRGVYIDKITFFSVRIKISALYSKHL